jgi:hypothetical protein
MKKCSIGFNANLVFEKVWWFEIELLELFNFLFDLIQKNVKFTLKFGSDNWRSF